MFSHLPFCIAVANRKGKILFLQDSENLLEEGTGDIQEFPDEIRELFLERIAEVMETKKTISENYRYKNMYCKVKFVHLPEILFREKTVMWISQNITDEYKKNNELKFQHSLLKSAAEVAKLYPFRYNEGKITQRICVDHIWPYINGKPVPPEDWICDEDLPAFMENWEKILSGGIDHFSLPYSTKSKEQKKYFVISVRKEFNEYTNDIDIAGIIQDVTQERERDIQSLNHFKMLQYVTEHLPGCYFFVKDPDHEMRYLLCNREFEKVFGISREQIIGKNILELLPNREEAEQLHRNDLEVAISECVEEHVEHFHDIHDVSVSRHAIKTVLCQSDGKRLLLGVGLDITKQKKMEQEKQFLLEQEHLIRTCLEKLLESSEPDVLPELLKLIGTYTKAFACYIYRFDIGAQCKYSMGSWSANGQKTEYEKYRIDATSANYLAFLRHEVFVRPDLEKSEQTDAVQILRKRGLRSLISAGIWYRNSLYCSISIGFSEPRNDLNELTTTMQTIAHLLEFALENRVSQEKARSGETEKRLILENIDIPVVLFDKNMTLLQVNKAACHLAGMENQTEIQLTGCHRNFCHHQEPPEFCPVQRTIRDGKPHSEDIPMNGKVFQAHANPVFIGGTMTYIVETLVDISEFNENQKHLTEAKEAAQTSDRAKDEFLTMMSHEMRTPLNAVIGYSELLQKTETSEQEKGECIQGISLAGNTLMNLINDILDFSKIGMNNLALLPAPLNLKNIFEDIRNIFQQTAESKKIELLIQVPEKMPRILLDPRRIRQVLLNLIGNAMKFTQNGKVSVSAEFEITKPEATLGRLKIAIKDSGVGIPQEMASQIFEPFGIRSVRGNQAYENSGLGLAITHRIVTKMGGSIELNSMPGKGSEFIVVLNDVVFMQPYYAKEEPQEINSTILLVDDVPMNLKVLGSMLRSLNIPYACASSGEEALKYILDTPPVLVMTDFWMPGMNGDELARKISENPNTAPVPIIAITADAQIPETHKDTFNAILLKPVHIGTIETIIRKYAPELFKKN